MADKNESWINEAWAQTNVTRTYDRSSVAVDNAIEGTSTVIDFTPEGALYIASKTELGEINSADDYALRAIDANNFDLDYIMTTDATPGQLDLFTNVTHMSGGCRTEGEVDSPPTGMWKWVHSKYMIDLDKLEINQKLAAEKDKLLQYLAGNEDAPQWPGQFSVDNSQDTYCTGNFPKGAYVQYGGGLYKCIADFGSNRRPGLKIGGVADWQLIETKATAKHAVAHLLKFGNEFDGGGFHLIPQPQGSLSYGVEHTRANPIWSNFGRTGTDSVIVGKGKDAWRLRIPYGTRWAKLHENIPDVGWTETWSLVGFEYDKRVIPLPGLITKLIIENRGHGIRPGITYQIVPRDVWNSQAMIDTIEAYIHAKHNLKHLHIKSTYEDKDEHPEVTEAWVQAQSEWTALQDLGMSMTEVLEFLDEQHKQAHTTHACAYPYQYWFGYIPIGEGDDAQKTSKKLQFSEFSDSNHVGNRFGRHTNGKWTLIVESFEYKEGGQSMCLPSGIYAPVPPSLIISGDIDKDMARVRQVKPAKWIHESPDRYGYSTKGGDINRRIGNGFQTPHGSHPNRVHYSSGSRRSSGSEPGVGTKILNALAGDLICQPPWNYKGCFGAPCMFCWKCWSFSGYYHDSRGRSCI